MRIPNSEKLKKDRIQNALATNTQLIEYETKLDSLIKKHDALEKSMPGLSAAIKTAEHKKHIVIDNYCDDKCTSEDLETAKKSYDEAVNIEERTVELLKVVNTKIANLNARLQDLREKKLKTKQLVWESLSDEANEDLQKKLGDMILWAYTVNRQRQRPLSYDDFLQMVVFPNPGAEEMKRFDPELGALYQKTLSE